MRLVLGRGRRGTVSKAIANQLEWAWTYNQSHLLSEYLSVLKREKIDAFYRHGNSCHIDRELFTDDCVVFNTPQGIRLVSNKPECKDYLISRGVSTPKRYALDNIIFPCVARPHYHCRGRHFYLLQSFKEFDKNAFINYYFQEYIEKVNEYRGFVFNGKIWEVNKKTKNRDDANMMIRNHRFGWIFECMDKIEIPKNLSILIEDTIKAIGNKLMFYSIDIFEDESKRFYVSEINSASGLMQRKIVKLAKSINNYLSDRI